VVLCAEKHLSDGTRAHSCTQVPDTLEWIPTQSGCMNSMEDQRPPLGKAIAHPSKSTDALL
jgi:hypothetical protein